MRNILILVWFLMLLPTGKACGQKFEVIGGIGYGQCRMQDLKEIQDIRLNGLGLPGKITDDFPWTIHYLGEFNVQFKNFSVGFDYFLLTSGSRISYGDYSGEVELDITTVVHGFGPSIMYPLFKNEKLWVGPRFQFPLMRSRITERDYIKIQDETQSTSDFLFSTSIGLYPSIEAKYSLSRLSFALNIGYLFDSKGVLVEGGDWIIHLGNQNYTTTDWSGFHFDFRLGYTFFKL